MRIVKVGCLDAKPQANASRYIATTLEYAFATNVEPVPVPEARIERFPASLPEDIATGLVERAANHGVSPAVLCAQLIEAAKRRQARPAATAAPRRLVGEAEVREVLRPMLNESWAAMKAGKIVFAEAATGSGKGRLIASLALSAAAEGQAVVVSAPLVVARQILEEIHRLDSAAPAFLLFGRPNFIDPAKLEDWLYGVDLPADHPLRLWHEKGGLPTCEETARLGRIAGERLAWLAEDAVQLADEDTPLDTLLLDDEAQEGNEAEEIYQRLRARARERQHGDIVICSHSMLAADCRMAAFNPEAAVLPERIDMLLVDEAHELERAWAAIHSQTLHLMPLLRHARDASLRPAERKAVERACEALIDAIRRYGTRLPVTGTLAALPELEASARQLHDAIGRLAGKGARRKGTDSGKALSYAMSAMRSLLSGFTTIQAGVSPVRHYPLLTVGRANLETSLDRLWSRVGAAALVSATLYLPESRGSHSAGHARWVLCVPKARAYYMPPVSPSWVTDSATLHVLQSAHPPDDSAEWLEETARQAAAIHKQARGGALVLCTSYATVEALADRLAGLVARKRLIVQSATLNAAACARAFRAAGARGERPLWLGVGSAWTGVDLTDKDVDPASDVLLTDLFVPRLPFGLNRTLTHDRRVRSLGFMVEVQEMIRTLRQGIGRLVRREGVPERRLWIGDRRMTSEADSTRAYVQLARKALARYRVAAG